jgi:hypothetical protein
MRVSLTAVARPGICSKCGAGSRGVGPAQVIPFTLIVDGHAGEAGALCQGCLFYPEGVVVQVPMENLSPGPSPRRKDLKKAKKASARLEADVALELNEVYGEGAVRTQPGSGNQRGAKSDLRMKDGLRVEEKHTQGASFSIKLDELYKVAGEAAGGEMPLFVIDFVEPGTRKLKDRFAVLHFQDLKGLLHVAHKHR